jgi:hypothetical protein
MAKSDHSMRGFSFLFPGIDRRVVTLPQNFKTPFLREYFRFMGAVDSDKATFRNILSRKSTALIVVVGGAAEHDCSKPYHRFGFGKTTGICA